MLTNDLPKEPYNVEHHAEAQPSAANLKIPYDDAPFEGVLQFGEKKKFYGDIEILNKAMEPCHVKIRFDLRRGFLVTIKAEFSPIEFEVPLQMHSSHAIQVVDDTWQLTAKNR